MNDLPAGVAVVPVRTPTLPPATHTNTWVLGVGECLVVDPASPWPDGQAVLADALDTSGHEVVGLFLTHHHADHVGGVEALRTHLAGRGRTVPVIAHPATAALLEGRIRVDVLWEEGETHVVGGRTLQVLHTPGHAPGHLCLRDRDHGAVVAGDMVAGVGTIAIDPDEGDLGDYLHHLGRLRALRPSVLLPAHGPALWEAEAVLTTYIAHRHMRSEQIREALATHGAQTPRDLAPRIYPTLDPRFHPLAARQILTHLQWMRSHGLAHERAGGWATE